ncbi:META domain-containing protein [Aliidiomarina sp. Khilg15.8]
MRMTTSFRLLASLLMSLMLIACGDTSDSDSKASSGSLTEVFVNSEGVVGTWRLLSVETRDSGEQPVDPDDTYHVEFSADGTFEGVADCNYFHGTYTIGSEQQLRVGALDGSRAACDLPSFWHRYLAVLQSALRYERMGDRLVVHSTLSAQLVFVPAQQSDSARATY